MGGGGLSLIDIHATCLRVMPQGGVVLNGGILVPRIESASNATTTDVLRLDSTERQRSFQNRLHRRNGS